MEGGQWVRNIMLTSFIYCGPFFLTFCFNNTLAIIYEARSSPFPFSPLHTRFVGHPGLYFCTLILSARRYWYSLPSCGCS